MATVSGDRATELCAEKSTFLPDRTLDEDINALLRLKSGGKGLLTVSQVATGEENGFKLRIYASKGAVLWAQENPTYLHVHRHRKPRGNPGYRLKAKSRKAVSGRYLSMEECQRLLSVVSGAGHLAFRIFIQLGLCSEELFALRRNDVVEDTLRIDEAIVEGASGNGQD
jgi:predicted dehydrogenase